MSGSENPASSGDDERAKAYYDDFSGWYERGRSRGYHGMVDDLEVEITSRYAEGSDILELGCGTGLILERLSMVAESAKGIDISAGMIEKAKQRGLDVSLGSVTELDFEDESFDLVYSFKVLAHVPDIGKALAEAARVTRPGGAMVLEFYNPWSLRYLAKRLAGPQKISEGRTEADMYWRWDSPLTIPKILPPGVDLEGLRGVRVVTPAAFVHRVPLLGSLVERAEWASFDSPLRYFGGFLVAILRKRA